MVKRPRKKSGRPSQRKRLRRVEELHQKGATFVAQPEQLDRMQMLMLNRFAATGVPKSRWRHLRKCDGGDCPHRICSAACWYGDRDQANTMTLEAVQIFEDLKLPLKFITIIDPLRATSAGDLNSLNLSGLMQALRRQLRACSQLDPDALAFGYAEVALEILPDGREIWSLHTHILIGTTLDAKELRIALRPLRRPPHPSTWGRARWRPVVVAEADRLAYLLDYIAKRTPEQNRNLVVSGRTRKRFGARLQIAHQVEHDRWLLDQKPGDRLFLFGLRRVHGRLAVHRRPR